MNEFDVTVPVDTNPLSNTVNENAPQGTLVGLTVTSIDPDQSNNAIHYSLDNDANGRFGIEPLTGVVFVASGSSLNREASATHSIEVRAISTDGSFRTQTFVIAVNDVDEFDVTKPVDSDSSPNSISDQALNGDLVGITASSVDSDAIQNTITYQLVNSAGDDSP